MAGLFICSRLRMTPLKLTEIMVLGGIRYE